MSANAYAAAAGTKIYYGDPDAVDPATALGGIDSIDSIPVAEVDEFEITRVDQEDTGAHDWWKQFAPDHIDPGELSFKLAMNSSTMMTLYALVRQMKSWKILFSNGDKVVCNGFIKSLGQEYQDRDEIIIPITVRWSGKPTYSVYV